MMHERYNFDLKNLRFWRDLFRNPRYIMRMWGFSDTIKFIFMDTFLSRRK